MRGLSKFVLALAFATGATATDAAEPANYETRLALLRNAFVDLAEANQLRYEIGTIEMLPPLTGFARSHGSRIEIGPIALDLFEDRAGARALAALLITYVARPTAPAEAARSGVAENVAAAGAVLAGMALDPHKSRDVNLFDWQTVPGRASDPQSGTRMLAMLEKAQGCSGPLVKLLNRASLATARDPATSQLVYLARRANRDLGRIAYPPDFRCTAGS